MFSILKDRIALVHIIYRDGTELCFTTTLNPQILAEKGIILQEDSLPVLDKKYSMHKQQFYKQVPLKEVTSFNIVDKPIYQDKKAEILSAFF